MSRSHIRTLVGHFIKSIICDLEQNIWWGFLIRAVTALKQHNSEVIVDLARPMKVVTRSHIRTLVGHFLESIKCYLEQNIWWEFLVRAVTALKQHDFSVIVDLAQPMKVVRRSHIRTLVGHFLENITCDLEQNIWWGIWSSFVTGLKQHNSNVIVDLARPMKVVRRSHIRTLVGHFLENIKCDLKQNIWWGF